MTASVVKQANLELSFASEHDQATLVDRLQRSFSDTLAKFRVPKLAGPVTIDRLDLTLDELTLDQLEERFSESLELALQQHLGDYLVPYQHSSKGGNPAGAVVSHLRWDDDRETLDSQTTADPWSNERAATAPEMEKSVSALLTSIREQLLTVIQSLQAGTIPAAALQPLLQHIEKGLASESLLTPQVKVLESLQLTLQALLTAESVAGQTNDRDSGSDKSVAGHRLAQMLREFHKLSEHSPNAEPQVSGNEPSHQSDELARLARSLGSHSPEKTLLQAEQSLQQQLEKRQFSPALGQALTHWLQVQSMLPERLREKRWQQLRQAVLEQSQQTLLQSLLKLPGGESSGEEVSVASAEPSPSEDSQVLVAVGQTVVQPALKGSQQDGQSLPDSQTDQLAAISARIQLLLQEPLLPVKLALNLRAWLEQASQLRPNTRQRWLSALLVRMESVVYPLEQGRAPADRALRSLERNWQQALLVLSDSLLPGTWRAAWQSWQQSRAGRADRLELAREIALTEALLTLAANESMALAQWLKPQRKNWRQWLRRLDPGQQSVNDLQLTALASLQPWWQSQVRQAMAEGSAQAIESETLANARILMQTLFSQSWSSALPELWQKLQQETELSVPDMPEALARELAENALQSLPHITTLSAPESPGNRSLLLEQSLTALKQSAHALDSLKLRSTNTPKEQYETDDAGLLLLWPHLARLFTRRQLLDDQQQFVDEVSQRRAMALLVAACGLELPEQATSATAALLCGLEPETSVDELPQPDTSDQRAVDHLVQTLISQWQALKGMPPASLRSLFLQRRGVYEASENGWKITVADQAQDILLQALPWPVSMIHLPWLSDQLISVHWQKGAEGLSLAQLQQRGSDHENTD